MKITILTLFPKMFKGPFDQSIIKRAIDKNLVSIKLINIRNFGIGRHKIVDDRPFGGGVGMVMRVDVVERAISKTKDQRPKIKDQKRVVLLDPRGKVFNQKKAQQLSKYDHLILICGHYEGIDERIIKFVDEEISIGDYVLTGGELPAMVIVDTVVRLIKGVLEKKEAIRFESFSKPNLLEYPQYTKPKDFKGLKVPNILLSGNHQKVAKWREKQAIEKTKVQRPDLLKPDT